MDKAELETLPEKPGVYFFFDDQDEILYIGKSVNLKKRVCDHFSKRKERQFQKVYNVSKRQKMTKPKATWDYTLEYLEKSPVLRYNKELKKKRQIIQLTRTIKYIITESSEEAFTLEGSLIAAIKPPLNQMTWEYPLIEVTLGEAIPRVIITRQVSQTNSYIFGPFNVGTNIQTALTGFLRIIPLCDYAKPLKKGKSPHCFKGAFNQCMAPCKRPDQIAAYLYQVQLFIEQLEHQGVETIKKLERIMEREIAEEKFEAAAKSRDQLLAIKTLFDGKVIPLVLKKYMPAIQEILHTKTSLLKILENFLQQP